MFIVKKEVYENFMLKIFATQALVLGKKIPRTLYLSTLAECSGVTECKLARFSVTHPFESAVTINFERIIVI